MLDDPQLPADVPFVHRSNECPASIRQFAGSRTTRQSENGNPGVVLRREDQRIPEFQIERHETASLGATDGDQIPVACRRQSLLVYGSDVVTGLSEDVGTAHPEIFVQFDFHGPLSDGMSTYRSRDISAP